MCVLLVILLLIGLGVFWIEARHRLRPSSPLKLRQLDWSVRPSGDDLELQGWIEISNPHKRMEVMVPELQVNPVLIGSSDLNDVTVKTRITPHHPDEDTRADGYWPAYIVKGRKSTRIQVSVTLRGQTGAAIADRVDTVWMDVNWVNYGPFGRVDRRQGVVVPLRKPAVLQPSKAEFRSGENCQVLPLKTHLLGPLDSTIDVLRDYAGELVQPGDILTIGETPVAVIQGRYTHPSMVVPTWIARLLCRVFHPTSSLATACGLQTLIDQVGPTRVILAWSIGLALKIVGLKGWFYRLAGEQARLIDDITGTTPPYDQTIVLGPSDPVHLCQNAADALGVAVAIVDVNDLGRVKVLASSNGCDEAMLYRALRPNPAGNANERTPLVLVRPS